MLVIKFIKKAFRDMSSGRNLKYYITLLFILVILALDIFNLAPPDVLVITLAVLALVVSTSFGTRESLEAYPMSSLRNSLQSFTQLDYCQYLLSSPISYTILLSI